MPVPRWVTLKFGEVSARNGPGEDHRLLWTYRAKGLPLQIVAETRDWRRVCDGDGQLAWVHKRAIDGRRNVMNLTGAPVPVQDKAKVGAATEAYLAPGAIAELDQCRDDWCRLETTGLKGWAPAGQLWGTAEALGCNAPPRR